MTKALGTSSSINSINPRRGDPKAETHNPGRPYNPDPYASNPLLQTITSVFLVTAPTHNRFLHVAPYGAYLQLGRGSHVMCQIYINDIAMVKTTMNPPMVNLTMTVN